METLTKNQVTEVPIDPEDGRTHPYGVRVGDPVHFWRTGVPPLSSTYEAPACWYGLVLGFSYDLRSIWLADLAVVDPETGAVRIERAAPQAESFGSTPRSANQPGEPSWGVGASWHRIVTHPGAFAAVAVRALRVAATDAERSVNAPQYAAAKWLRDRAAALEAPIVHG